MGFSLSVAAQIALLLLQTGTLADLSGSILALLFQSQRAAGKLEGIDELYLGDMRYSAQSFTIPVNLTEAVRNGTGLDGFYKAFHEEHKALFGFSNPDTPVAFNELMVRTSGRQAKPRSTIRAR
ncbi:N-methylhydantoinase A/oxoprolinase/acetone carboxylase beta subunit [Bradyrhizobium sp. USDA 3397]